MKSNKMIWDASSLVDKVSGYSNQPKKPKKFSPITTIKDTNSFITNMKFKTGTPS